MIKKTLYRLYATVVFATALVLVVILSFACGLLGILGGAIGGFLGTIRVVLETLDEKDFVGIYTRAMKRGSR